MLGLFFIPRPRPLSNLDLQVLQVGWWRTSTGAGWWVGWAWLRWRRDRPRRCSTHPRKLATRDSCQVRLVSLIDCTRARLNPFLTYLCSETPSIIGTPCRTPSYLLAYPSDGILVKIRVIFDFPGIYNVSMVCGNIFQFVFFWLF